MTAPADPELREAADSLYAALASGDAARARLLMRQRPALIDTPSPAGPTPLLAAVYYGQEGLAREWAKLRPPILAEACALGLADRAMALIDADSSLLDAPGPDGFTPVAIAAYFGHEGLLQRLVAAGADINKPSDNRFAVNALHAAVAQGKGAVVAFLLGRGAQVDQPQQDGFTALHVAAGQGLVPIARQLLKAGADPLAKAEDGRTPADLAREAGQEEAALLIEDSAKGGAA